jgi:hypothetical protein
MERFQLPVGPDFLTSLLANFPSPVPTTPRTLLEGNEACPCTVLSQPLPEAPVPISVHFEGGQ